MSEDYDLRVDGQGATHRVRDAAAKRTLTGNTAPSKEIHTMPDADRTLAPEPSQILAARQTLKKTQQAMAKILGVTHATYCRWENGHVTPMPVMRKPLWRLIDLAARQERSHG